MKGARAPETTVADMHELVEVRLRRADLRYTPGRRTIVELLISEGHPVSLPDIEAKSARRPKKLGLPSFGRSPASRRGPANRHE